MAQKNSEYWQERFNALNESLLNKGEKYNKELTLAYAEAMQNIQEEIEVFYERFAANNLISLSDAKKILNSDERKAFQMTLEDYIKYGKQNSLDGKWIKELESASDIYRMDRLRSLQLQMRQQVEILEAKKATGLSDVLNKIYEDGYYHSIYEIQKGLGEGMAFATLDTNKIEKVLSKPWAPDGSTFSQKIWGSDRTNLLYQLDTKFTQALIRGDNPNRIVKEMANTLNVSKSAASRLVMTESAYVASASRKDGYKALDVEEFEYVATLDLKTSDLCQSMDGQHFPMSQYQVGVNAPPLHPWCRSTTVPYFNDEFTAGETRTARGEDGKTYKVPADMKYKDWHKEHVETNSEMLMQEKKFKNKYADQKQYESYKSVLEQNAPKTFDMFKDLKYNNSDEWKYLKLDFKRRNSLMENPTLALPNAEKAIAVDEKFTRYLFNPESEKGYPKGKAFADRLGYGIENYKELQKSIIQNASKYPAFEKGKTEYGTRYEQKIILQGEKGTPANVVVGWIENDGTTKLTSAYIKEVKLDED